MQKKSYWSINHNQKKRDAQRNWVKNNFRKKYNNNEAKRHIRTYIVDYESTDFALRAESNESDIEKKIEISMIDFDSSETFESNEIVKNSFVFIIDFEIINELEILTADLINQFFNHRVNFYSRTKIVFEVVFEIVFEIVFMIKNVNYAWIFVSIKRYTKKKFFEIMIDTEASAYLTIGCEQFLAYNKIIETAINSVKTEAVNVQFDIKSISFIKFITIATFIDQIEFYVVKIDTFFCYA